jgi:hypothetical protein
MIEEVYLWTFDVSFDCDPVAKQKLTKLYGSRRSGTIYLAAKNAGEAESIAQEMFTRNGYKVPKRINVYVSDHVKKMLRTIY